jgi:predicted aspartyl protease
MGTFRVAIEVGDEHAERWESIEALVDTGATYSKLPAPLLARLGITPQARATFVLADGREVARDIGHGWIRVAGRSAVTIFVFGESDAGPLLGAYALEGLRLAPDPVGRRLLPVPGLLMPALAG